MKYLFLLVALSIIGCSQQKKDCLKFKTGSFKYEDPTFKELIVTRNDSLQIEYDESKQIEMTASIKWLSNCTYKLRYIKVSDTTYNHLLDTEFKVDITDTSERSYHFHAYNSEKELFGEMVKN